VSKPLQQPSHRDSESKRRPIEPATRNDDLTGRIIGGAIEVHRHLGPDLLESIYESALAVEFEMHGIGFRRQAEIPISYRGRVIGAHKLDFIAENVAVLELKSVERFDPLFEAQVLTYMRIANLKLGLLINFNFPFIARRRQGIYSLKFIFSVLP